MNLINPDAFIVRQNLVRYEAGGELDAHYLGRLSADAVPGLVGALDDVAGDEEQYSRYGGRCTEGSSRNSRCETLTEIMEDNLADRLGRLKTDGSWRRWQAWNYARSRAYGLLVAR